MVRRSGYGARRVRSLASARAAAAVGPLAPAAGLAAVPGDAGAALSEPAATPALVVVHDPGRTGALAALRRVPPDELTDRYLFRDAPDPESFSAQHDALVAAIRAAGIEVVRLADLVPEDPELARNPNQVYTRDAAITLPWLPGVFLRGAMRVPVRRPEAALMAAALGALGLREALAAPPRSYLEGGDVIPLELDGGRTLLVGFGPRTARDTLDLLWRELSPDVLIGVRLAEWRMNLDGALVPVAPHTVVAHPESIEDAFLRDKRGVRRIDVLDQLAGAGLSAIEVTQEEAMELQACNVLCLGEGRVVCYDLAPRVLAALRERGLDVRTIPASELIKGTGGPRCMTRPIYG